MASTSSLGAQGTTNSAEAQQFYYEFNEKLQDVRQRIDSASTAEDLSEIALVISECRARLTDKTEQLPTYDQQTHEQNIRRVYQHFADKQNKVKPSRKFAFRRKEKPADNSSAADTSLSASQEQPSASTEVSAPKACNRATDTDYVQLSRRHAETLTHDSFSTTVGQQRLTGIRLDTLKNCVVDLRGQQHKDVFLAAQARDLVECVILLGDIRGSVYVDHCRDCVLVVSCRQFRMHNSQNIAVFVDTSSVATIERCQDISFARASPLALSGSPQHTEHDATRAVQVQDFDHINTQTQSPYWHYMDTQASRKVEECIASSDHLQRASILAIALPRQES